MERPSVRWLALGIVVAAALGGFWAVLGKSTPLRPTSNATTREAHSGSGESAREDQDLTAPGDMTPNEDGARESAQAPETEVADGTGLTASSLALSPLPEVEGTAVLGTLLDRVGEPVGTVPGQFIYLHLSDGDEEQKVVLAPRSDGRFIREVGLEGDVTVHVSMNNLGRSLDQDVFLPEGRTTELGEVRLLGEGVISGMVQLPDGNPPGRISIQADSLLREPGPGLRRAKTIVEDDGSFELRGLAQGSFEFSALRHTSHPIVGNDRANTGTRDALIVVDLVRLLVHCVSSGGERTNLRHYELANLPVGHASDWSVSGGLRDGPDELELLCRTGWRYIVRVTDTNGRAYAHIVEADTPAGLHFVDISQDNPALGSVRLLSAVDRREDGAELTFSKFVRDGVEIDGGMEWVGQLGDLRWVEKRGLLPGRYEIQARIKNARWSSLVDPRRTFELQGGDKPEFTFEVQRGGRIRLAVTLGDSAGEEAPTSATVSIREAAKLDWSFARLTSSRGSGSRTGPSVWTDGTPGRSSVLAPGNHRLRVRAPGYLTAEADAIVTAGEETSIDLELMPEN